MFFICIQKNNFNIIVAALVNKAKHYKRVKYEKPFALVFGSEEKLSLTSQDRKIISNYLNTCLKIHIDGINNFKSLKFMKETMG